MVKLVEYSESSDEELHRPWSDGRPWFSLHACSPSPSDSFVSYKMQSFESEEDDDDDEEEEGEGEATPSRTSLETVSSVASSVDTGTLNWYTGLVADVPLDTDATCVVEDQWTRHAPVVPLTHHHEPQDAMGDAWHELKAAFNMTAFQKRSLESLYEINQEQKTMQAEETHSVEPQQVATDDEGPRDVSVLEAAATGLSAFQPVFTPGIAEKKRTRPRRRNRLTRCRSSGIASRVWTLLTEKQEPCPVTNETSATNDTSQVAETSTEKVTRVFQGDGETSKLQCCAFQTRQKKSAACSLFGDKQTDGNTRDFTCGKKGAAGLDKVLTDDTHMRSPSPKRTAAASFVPVDGVFTLGQSGEHPKPYNFGNGGSEAAFTSAQVRNTTNDEDDALMRSPIVQGKPASRCPTSSEFLFGQAYKNRKPHAFSRQKRNESLDLPEPVFTPIIKPPTDVSGIVWERNDRVDGTSSGNSGANSEPTIPTLFSTGVAGPNIQHRNSHRRKKKGSSMSTFAPILESKSSKSQCSASSSSLGSSLFQSAAATRQRPRATFTGSNAHESNARPSDMASAVPTKKSFITSASGLFASGNSNAKTFPEAFPDTDSSSFRTDEVGSATSSAAPATLSAGSSGQVLLDQGTSRNVFKFGNAETNLPTKGANSHFPADNVSSATVDGFQIGSLDTQKNPRVRPRRNGMFTHKNSPRKDAKIGATEPEPSPSSYSRSSSAPSPFGMSHRRARKNARLRKCRPHAGPFVTHTFQCQTSPPPSDRQLHLHAERATATPGFGSSIGAISTDTDYVGGKKSQDHSSDPGVLSSHPQRVKCSASQPQNLNDPSLFRQNEVSKPAKIQETSNGGARPAYAGSRRILRAALRSVGVSGDRASSAPPAMGNRPDEVDAEMDSEDERDWLELKRLGGVAYSSRQYEDAAEYYRQSIELLESLSYHDPVMYTAEMRTNKAKLHANRAASLMMLMQIAEAQRECRRSIEVNATYARAYIRLGRIQVLLGEAANAQANIDTARQLMEGPDNEVSSGNEADYASLTRVEAGIKKLTMLQGDIKWYVDCGDLEQAVAQTNAALTLAPNSRKLQVEKARILLRQKKFDQIIGFCTCIIEKHQASHGKISSRASAVDTKPCKEKIVEQIAIVGIELGLLWATTLHYQNKVEDAVQILDALEVVAPCSSHVIQLKRQWQDMKQLKHDGNERYQQGNFEEAVRFYSEALQIDSQHQEFCAIIYCNRSAAQMGLKRYHTAILDCNESLQRKPSFSRALLRRARCHVALKMYHEAVKDFERCLREQPSSVPVNTTADVHRECNEAKAAIVKAREEASQQEAAKKRAERQQRHQRQQHSHHGEDASWNDSKFHGSSRRGASSNNGDGHGSSRFESSGDSSRDSNVAPESKCRTYYEVLGIRKGSTTDQIRKSYRKLALVYHPDKAKTLAHDTLFKEMTAAYNVLSDESARAKYDRGLVYRLGKYYET